MVTICRCPVFHVNLLFFEKQMFFKTSFFVLCSIVVRRGANNTKEIASSQSQQIGISYSLLFVFCVLWKNSCFFLSLLFQAGSQFIARSLSCSSSQLSTTLNHTPKTIIIIIKIIIKNSFSQNDFFFCSRFIHTKRRQPAIFFCFDSSLIFVFRFSLFQV